ncbi:hypothetical protein [Natronorubrum bangense]|nr:hypothetical protein [Natronorubrum bangense]
MNRRRFFLSSGVIGITGVAGCLDEDVCDKTSNHLYVENYLSESQTVRVRVYRLKERMFADTEWEQTFSETIELPGERRSTIEQIYDTHGTYRTEAEHEERLEQNRSEVDDCEDRVVTIGIGDGAHSIMNGRPDELLPEAESDSDDSR